MSKAPPQLCFSRTDGAISEKPWKLSRLQMSLGHPSSIFGAWASGDSTCCREEGQRKRSCGLGAWREIGPHSLFAAKTVYLQVRVFHGNGDRQRKNALVKHFHEFMLFIWSVTALQRGLWGLTWSGTQGWPAMGC